MSKQQTLIAIAVTLGVLLCSAAFPAKAGRAYWETHPGVGFSTVEITLQLACTGNLACFALDGYASTRTPVAAGVGTATLLAGGSIELNLDTPLGDPTFDAWTLDFESFAFDEIPLVGTPVVQNGRIFGTGGGPLPIAGLSFGAFAPLPIGEMLPVGFVFDVTGLATPFPEFVAGPAPESTDGVFEMLDAVRFELRDFGWTVSDSQDLDLMPGTLTVTATAIVDLNLAGKLLLELFADGPSLNWTGFTDALNYDVVGGDLTELRAAAGDLGSAGTTCIADDHPSTALPLGSDPRSGTGQWFLVRRNTIEGVGSYDTPFESQTAARDPRLSVAPQACP